MYLTITAPENTTLTRSTKKAIVKDIELIEEKPVTPSRRSARIKSNTSIMSETTQGIDSPRAKRASRRTSQVGMYSLWIIIIIYYNSGYLKKILLLHISLFILRNNCSILSCAEIALD